MLNYKTYQSIFLKSLLVSFSFLFIGKIKAQINNGTNTLGGTSSSSGNSNTVSGAYSFSNGQSNNVTGGYSSALGLSNTVAGYYSNALGYNNNVSGHYSFAAPSSARAQNTASVGLGYYADANANYAIAIGNRAKSTGASAVSIGYYSEATGLYSHTLGAYTKTSADYSMVIGSGINSATKLNNSTNNTLMIGFNSTIPTFFVGTSAGAGTTGKVGVATSTPDWALDVEGNVSTNNYDIYLRGGTDVNHGLGWYGSGKLFGTTNPDGPVLYGYGGGALGIMAGGAQSVLTWTSAGNVGIGTDNTQGYKLAVKGSMIAEEVVVKLYATWPDYVFGKKYNLETLSEVEKFIVENNHLPNVPSEIEVKESGINLGEMDAILLRKIEELTLYTIEQQKLIEKQGNLIDELIKAKK